MQLPTRILALTLATGALAPLAAQTHAPAPPPEAPTATAAPAPGNEPPLRLARFEVSGVPLERSVNPLTRPLEAVFGDSRSVLDTPRAVSTISQALLRERGIEGVREFVAYAPGAYAPASYGKATTPNLRGDLAETFQNGQRLSYNNFGYAPSFNSIEALDVVRAPGSALYGSGYFTGGYVNYVTKRPKFTRETTVTLRLGEWVPSGGSWFNSSWQLDTTGPSADGQSAWRLSYEGKEDDTFFRRHGGRDDRQDVFVSWIRHVHAGLTLEVSAQFMWQASPQLLGVNRPTQALIDSGLYQPGEPADLGFNEVGALAGVIPAGPAVQILRDATLLSPGDFSNATIARAQFTATAQLAPDRQLIHRTLVELVDRRRHHGFAYDEYAEQFTFEHRAEWHAALATGPVTHALTAGGTLRYEARESYTNYFNEFFFQFDLTRPNQVFSHERDFPASFSPGLPGPGGRLFFPASFGSPETTDSKLFNPALFVQDELALTDQTSLLAGLRADGFFARARDPLGPVSGLDWRDRHHDTGLSANASLLHRLSPDASLYATYQSAVAVHGNVTGGGVLLKDDGTGRGVIDPHDFTNRSRLAELGARFALLDHRLSAGATVYQQRREEVSLGGSIQRLRVRGAELEFVYQPTARFNATLNAAFTDGRFDDSTAGEAGGTTLYNLFAAGAGPDGRGNGRGFQWDQLPPGDYRIPGLSRWVVNGSFSATLPSGLGAGLGGSWQSRQPGNLADDYHLPAQLFVNAFVFYRRPRWEANLDLLNVLGRRNWIHNGDLWSDNVLLFQDLPFRLEGSIKFKL